ncbi:helix-turn-helix transcriptional regulator [Methanolobus halotolerans]|uniref:Transcriptional regulator n=1 Tax=Methanolobus halotolerans TaxID=2052935 RepID=A0A4E0Q3P8_9EURY|nr:winged helix-turn-helix domain-containing protein [Methanolobus halotolerans]TGC08172.1 transcriptional regulator [Methanolobus halotolerans]
MKKPLLDVIFASEKRKNVLLLLQDGPRGMKYILDQLETTRQALLPHVRILEDYHLITDSMDTYELTDIGKLIVNKMTHLVSITEVLDTDIDFWGTRKLDFLPSPLLNRINELGKCRVISPPVTDIFELDKDITDTSYKSRSLSMIAASLHPGYPHLFNELAHKGINIRAIFSKSVFDSMKSNYSTYLEELIKNESFNLYVYSEKMDFLAFVYNDFNFLMRMLKVDGTTDNKYILCKNPPTLRWTNDFFEYYLKDSTPITEL